MRTTNLSPAEARLREKLLAGEPADLRTVLPKANGATSDTTHVEVRASVLQEVLLDEQVRTHSRSITLNDLRITGPLDLSFAELGIGLDVEGCELPDGLILDSATFHFLHLRATAAGFLSIRGAKVNDDLILGDTTLEGTSAAFALRADRAEILGGFEILGSTVIGRCSLRQILIGTHLLIAQGSQFKDESVSLDGSNAVIKGLFSLEDSVFAGTVWLNDIRVHGNLILRVSTFERSRDWGPAITLDAAAVLGTLWMEESRVGGETRAVNATFGAGFNLYGSLMRGDPEGYALNAQGLAVRGDVVIEGGSECWGEANLRLLDAHNVYCRDGRIKVLDLGGARISGTLDVQTSSPLEWLGLADANVGRLSTRWSVPLGLLTSMDSYMPT